MGVGTEKMALLGRHRCAFAVGDLAAHRQRRSLATRSQLEGGLGIQFPRVEQRQVACGFLACRQVFGIGQAGKGVLRRKTSDVVGGADGWGRLVPALAYHADNGVSSRLVADDVARLVGETIVEWSPTAVGVHSDGRLLYVNPAAVALFGAGSAAELVGTPGVDRVHPDYRQNSLARNQHLTSGARTVPVITQKFLKLDGTVFEAEVQSITINYDGAPAVYVAISDITARRQADDALHASLREKEALLKEVHHRVKNNLQVIMSLLRMEGRRSTQPATKSVLGEMQSRIRSMALLHESLYRSGTFAAVDLASYLTQLATQVFRSAQTSPHAVRLELALAPVLVEMDQALPCGLLVNELLSNALKHAFPAGRPGSVHISLQPLVAEPGRWCLAVADDGVGLPADLELRRHQSLGLQLAADLACQLHGTLAISSAAGATGTRLAVTFSIMAPPPSARP